MVKISLKISISFLVLLGLNSSSLAESIPNRDVVMQAMGDELNRSMTKLSIPGAPAPYFLGYRVTDVDSLYVEMRYGALLGSQINKHRNLNLDLRVGSPQLDNSNYFDSWMDLMGGVANLPEEDVYTTIRQKLWYFTDRIYKESLERLSRKIAYLQMHPDKDALADFSSVKPYSYRGPAAQLTAQPEDWKSRIKLLNPLFLKYSKFQDWNVVYAQYAVNSRYIDSDKNQYFQGDLMQSLMVTATTQTEDGQRLTHFVFYESPGTEVLPKDEIIKADVDRMLQELTAATTAPRLEEYSGPVLFMDWAAAQFFSQLFVKPLSLPRKPLTVGMEDLLTVGKLAGKIRQKVLPEFVSIADKPQIQNWKGRQLAGYDLVDAEGVQTQDINLVDHGRLVTIPLGRQPLKKIPASNGHAISSPYQMNVPGISNLFITTDKPLSREQLIAELRQRCLDRDLEFGLMVTRLEDPYFSKSDQWITESADAKDEKEWLTAPMIVFKVYAKDGRLEAVRGLAFDEVSIRTLKDIAALGNDSTVYNIMQATLFRDDYYSAAIITPSVLVDEIELKASVSHVPKPLNPNPIFMKKDLGETPNHLNSDK